MTDTPTPADRGRDLERDLATCEGTREGVSPGPWRESRVAAHDSEGEFCGHDLYVLDAAGSEIGGMCGYDDNAFVAAAREGWPAAIRRALAAEARVAELEAELAECRRVCESLAARCAAQSDLLSRRAEREGV